VTGVGAGRLRFELQVSDPSWLRFGRLGTAVFLVAGCLAITIWQLAFMHETAEPDRTYSLDSGPNGFFPRQAQVYFYFLYYTGSYPVATMNTPIHGGTPLVWSEQAAAERLRGDRGLVNEWGVYLRTGDLAKVYLLYPHAWRHGSPQRATLLSFNRALGLASLLAIFISFGLLGHRLLGSLLVILIGSDPFILADLYARNNVFAYGVPSMLLLLALNAPLVLGRWRGWGGLAAAFASGVFAACAREVRTEAALGVFAVAAGYLLAPAPWRRRLALLAVLAAALVGTSQLWALHWERSLEQARRLVIAAGGTPWNAAWNRHHTVWHPLWCGLGDFDQKYGYVWDDREAFRASIPELNRRFGTSYTIRPGGYDLELRHPTPPGAPKKGVQYFLRPETLPEYAIVVRDKILGDISRDPLWYATILAKRVARVLSETTPVRLAAGPWKLDVPFTGWLLLPALAALLALRSWSQLILLGYALTTSLTALLVYSGWGLTYASTYHLFLFALIVCWAINGCTAGSSSSPSGPCPQERSPTGLSA